MNNTENYYMTSL